MAGVSEGEVRKRLHQAGLTPGVIDAMVEGWAQDSCEQQQDGSKTVDEGVSQGQGVRAGSACLEALQCSISLLGACFTMLACCVW